MQTSFRSGILRHQTDRNDLPIFLRKVGSNVSIIVSPDPTIITFIDGSTDYIYTEGVTVTNAWNTAVDGAYLFWELNRVTGAIIYDATMLNPITQSTAPASPSTGQLWFDTINKYWFRFQGGWQRALIVFATKIVGISLTSMSDQAPVFRGTQVGINTSQGAGSLVYDLAGQAIQNSLGQFFTTEDEFTAGVPFGSSMRVEALATYALAQNSLAAYTVVRFNDFNQVVQATSGSQLAGTIGIIEQDKDVNGRVRITYAGPITNEAWDWSSYGIDAPIYVSNTGELTPSPEAGSHLPIARVIDKQTILFEPWLGTNEAAGGGGVTDHSLLTGLTTGNDHPQYLLSASAVTGLNDLSDVDVVGSPTLVSGMLLTYNGVRWNHQTPAPGGLQNIVEDVTPQLGGDLDTNGFNIGSQVNGGALTISTIDTTGAVNGGNVTIDAATAADAVAADGGDIRLYGGTASWTSGGTGEGGQVRIKGGQGGFDGGDGGDINLFAGSAGSTGNAAGGSISINPGQSSGTGSAGSLFVAGGPTNGNGATAGFIRLKGGINQDDGVAGRVELQGGKSRNASTIGGEVILQGGDSDNNSGGDIVFKSGIGGNTTDGNVILRPGDSFGFTPNTVPEFRFQQLGSPATYVALKSPDVVTTSRAWTLPQDDPATAAGQFLTTDASGILSFAGGGDISRIQNARNETYIETDPTNISGSPLLLGSPPYNLIHIGVGFHRLDIYEFDDNFMPSLNSEGILITAQEKGFNTPFPNRAPALMIGGGDSVDAHTGDAGDVRIIGGFANGPNSEEGGEVRLVGGDSLNDAGGAIVLECGTSGPDANGANITMAASHCTSSSSFRDGGRIGITAGRGANFSTAGDGGRIDLFAGDAYGNDSQAGNIELRAGNARGTTFEALPGFIKLQAGRANNGTSTVPGGNIILQCNDGGTGSPNVPMGAVELRSNSFTNKVVELRFREFGTNYVGFKAAVSLAGSQIWTLPIADGNNSDVLTTDGAGVLTWEAAGAGAGSPPALQNVVEDLTPQLGGNLDVNGFDIVAVGDTGGVGNSVTITASDGTTSTGGAINISAGAGTAGYEYGGDVTISGGNQTYAGDGYAGHTIIKGGTDGTNLGGQITAFGGRNYSGGNNYFGRVLIEVPNGSWGGAGSATGGIRLTAADNTYSGGNGGLVEIDAGNASVGAFGDGGDIVLTAGDATSSTDRAGNILLRPGRNASNNRNNVIISSVTSNATPFEMPELQFTEGDLGGTDYIGFKAPHAITASIAYELPEAPAVSGYILSSDTAGVMSWIVDGGAGGGATPYDIIAQSIGVPTDGDTLTRMVFTRAVTIGSGSPVAHQGYAAIPPSGGAGTISVYKASPPFGGSPAGILIGTLVFNSGSTSLDSETIAGTSFAVGDLIWFEMTTGNSMGDLTVTLDATAD